MNSFKTQFRIKNETSESDFFRECLNWILDSPHTMFAQENFSFLNHKIEFSEKVGVEELSYSIHGKMGAFLYKKIESNMVWTTDISYEKSESYFIVSVSSAVKTTYPGVETPDIKKPLLIIRLMGRFGGGYDRDLPYSISEFNLTDDDNGLFIASGIINGDINCVLPIVYVSRTYNDRTNVIVDRISRKLCGVAHVVVEPSRDFSHRLRKNVGSRNVYGGSVAIYWPSGGAITFRKEYIDPVKDFELKITEEVFSAVSNMLFETEYSFSEIQNIKNREAIKALKITEGDTSELCKLLEDELSSKDDELRKYKREIERLRVQNKHFESLAKNNESSISLFYDEEEYFDGEIKDLILEAIEMHLSKNIMDDSRRSHILKSIVDGNKKIGEAKLIHEKLKRLLNSYSSMNKKIQSGLEEIGFVLDEDGKHINITYQGDRRYTYVLPKSGSDSRGGKNASSDIINNIF